MFELSDRIETRILEKCYLMVQQALLNESEVTADGAALKDLLQPVPVVFPHFVKGDIVHAVPERYCLVRFAGDTLVIGRYKLIAMDSGHVFGVEKKFSGRPDLERINNQFLIGFTDGTFLRGLTSFQSSARSVDFAGSQASFFAD